MSSQAGASEASEFMGWRNLFLFSHHRKIDPILQAPLTSRTVSELKDLNKFSEPVSRRGKQSDCFNTILDNAVVALEEKSEITEEIKINCP